MTTAAANRLHSQGFLLDQLQGRSPTIIFAVALSTDGLLLAQSSGLSREDGEHISAIAAGFRSLALGAARHLDGDEVRQTIVEMRGGYLFVSAMGPSSCLAVAATAEADVEMIAYEMARLVTRAGTVLTPPLRAAS